MNIDDDTAVNIYDVADNVDNGADNVDDGANVGTTVDAVMFEFLLMLMLTRLLMLRLEFLLI